MNNTIKTIVPIIVIAILLFFIWPNLSETKSSIGNRLTSNWVTLSYASLVNKSVITHSGKTVGDVIDDIPYYTDETKGLVQPYLEPFSILCHDALLIKSLPDTIPLINILNHYPIGSEQPVWAALFREGHYQLYYNSNLIRVFVKGKNAKNSFLNHHSVIRHPINDILKSTNSTEMNIEVYVFNNDYVTNEIELNTVPHKIKISEFDLLPMKEPLDLNSIQEFFRQGVILEAVEVDNSDNLYFYGKKSNMQTMAGEPLSISDLAVIYRSIFHHGNNAPYISLDNHEDNRYAKVNFGGHLENTRVGQVVLEADKLFKSLGSGLDPNNYNLIKSQITKYVPDFLTEDERGLINEYSNTGIINTRYWFYPDSIGTVTDGNIGVLLTHQFLADVERMDIKTSPTPATRETISHLNRNFSQYEDGITIYKELRTVGRIMGLVNWLKGMEIDQLIELDDLLSVKISAKITPKKTKKMLAISTLAYTSNTHINKRNVRNYTKVYNLSGLLDNESQFSSDNAFLKLAENFFNEINTEDIAPYNYIQIGKSIDNLKNTISYKEKTLNRYSKFEVNEYNSLVRKLNQQVNEYNKLALTARAIYTIGGGINLRPNNFKKIIRNKYDPKLASIKDIKGSIKIVGKVSKSGSWIRNNIVKKNFYTNSISVGKWVTSRAFDGQFNFSYITKKGDFKYLLIEPTKDKWTSSTMVNGFKDFVTYYKSSANIEISHPHLSCGGHLRSNGKQIDFFQKEM